jgi:aspartate/methionine/tyrosine aminotransferase
MNLSTGAQKTPFSGVRAMFEKARRYDDAINLCIGEPGFVTPGHIIDIGVKYLEAGRTKYTPNAGIPEFRAAIAEKLARENNIRCDPYTNLIVTAGATQALMLTILTVVSPGDEVILPNPIWPDYIGQVYMANGVPVFADVKEENGFKMTAEVIEPLITPKTKLIMLNSPNNPTGAVLAREEIEEIAALVRKHKLFIISDEPYEHLIFDGEKHFSMGSIPGMEEYVITVNSLSKTYAMTGWRLGYICANEALTHNFIKLHEHMVASVNEAFQWAGIEALRHAADDVERMKAVYDRNRNLVVDGLNTIRNFSCIRPGGAFYAFPNIRAFGMSSVDAADMILERTHVAMAPGSTFGTAGEGFLRVSYAMDHESLEKALDRLAREFGTK